MQGKIDIRTVGRHNRDGPVQKSEDAAISPFHRSTDAVKPKLANPVPKTVTVEESKKNTIKKADPPRRSARIHKTTKPHAAQRTLLDAFAKVKPSTQKEIDHSTKVSSVNAKESTLIPAKRDLEQTQPSSALPAKKHCALPTPERLEEKDSKADDIDQPEMSPHDEDDTTQPNNAIPTTTHYTLPKTEHHEEKKDEEETELGKPGEPKNSHPEENNGTQLQLLPNDEEKVEEEVKSGAQAALESSIPMATTTIPSSDVRPAPESLEKDQISRMANWSAKSPAIEEKETLEKLRNALDISLTFHAGHQRVALFHNIQPMLRNSTRKNITLSHIAKILYLAPMLYHVTPKVLNQGRQALETYLIEFGKEWTPPLTGKELEQRKILLSQKLKEYFDVHGEVLVPEKELPKNEKVVDSKLWLEKTSLPSGVRDMLLFEQKRKEDEKKREHEKKEREATPIKQTGTVKERRNALLERIRAKSQKK